jgi:hypothetical protein
MCGKYTNKSLVEAPNSWGSGAHPMGRLLMTHKYRGCIVVLLINKSIEPNKKQKVLTSSFNQGITVNTSKWVLGVFDNADK